MKGELTMRALIILVITFAILATQFYWGVRKKKILGAIIPLVMTALFITISFLEKTAEPVNGQDERASELHPKSWTRKSTKGVQFIFHAAPLLKGNQDKMCIRDSSGTGRTKETHPPPLQSGRYSGEPCPSGQNPVTH